MVDNPLAPPIIERLDKTDDRCHFDCGELQLNDYLRFTARQHVDKGYAQVWVAVSESGSPHIIGYYSLSSSSIEPEDMPGEIGVKKVPVVLLVVNTNSTSLTRDRCVSIGRLGRLTDWS